MRKWQFFFSVIVCIQTLSASDCPRLWEQRKKGVLTTKAVVPSGPKYSIWKNLSVKYPVSESKPLVVVIASYNNEGVCECNLQSVFDQTYDNYRVIYVDDCSTDQTYDKVQRYIQARGKGDKVTLIHNSKRNRKLPNLYRAYHSCRDDEIIVCLDGDDWLAHNNVLTTINQCYQNPDVWLTYGSALNYPGFRIADGFCLTDDALRSNTIRFNWKFFYISMLRTFYAGLFKKVQLKDLFYQGQFFPSADDVAFMVPMVEMAPMHTLYIPDVLYMINNNNPMRETRSIRDLQNQLTEHICNQKKYTPLDVTFNPCNVSTLAIKTPLDLVVLSDNTPLLLATFLNNTLANLSPLDTITVLFRASQEEFQVAYQKVSQVFSNVVFYQDDTLSVSNFLNNPKNFSRRTSPYLVVATDTVSVSRPINMLECVRHMELTGAVGFFFRQEENPIEGILVNEGMSVLSLGNVAKVPELMADLFVAIFRKQFLVDALSSSSNDQGLLKTLCLSEKNHAEVALFSEKNSLQVLRQ